MAKTSALSSGGEAIHTRTDAAGTAESQVAVLGIDGSDGVIGTGNGGEATALRVTVAADSSGVLAVTDNGANLSIDDGGGSVTVDAPVGTPVFARLSNGTAALGVGAGGETTALRVTVANDSTGVLSVDDNGGSLTIDNPFLSNVGPGGESSAIRVTIADDSTGILSVDDNGGNLSIDDGGNSITVDNATISVIGSGTEATAQRVTIATDSTGVLSVDDNGGSLTVDNATISVVGGGTEAAAQRVTIANNSTGVLHVDDNAGSLTVDNATISVVGSGTEATAQRVTIATDSTGVLSVDDNGGSLTVDIGAGTNNIGDVDVLTLPGSLTGKAEDVASGPGDVGIPNLGVRNDTPTALTDTDGDYTMMATDKYGRVQIAPVRSLPKTIAVSGSLGITTAATWDERAVWAVPASTLFAPKMARAAVTTASTRTLILAGKQLATFNPGTNTFAATGSVTGNDFYDRLMYRIAVTHSATATNVTATYTDQGAATGNSTGALAIPSAAVAGDWYEFILAANDFGVQAVTAVSDSANPTTVVDEIWGFRTLLEDLGTAITPHISYLGEGLQVPNGESIVILFNAAATTAQQRFASVLGDLVAA